MKTSILNLLAILIWQVSAGQDKFYAKEYGNADNPAIIYLHGGPGYNSFSFEFSTAQNLADNGFFVIVYDQRGCGRTKPDANSLFTFNEAFEDLKGIYKKYNLKKASLIGHSFGGTLGILFSEKYPEKIQNLILVGSPLSYQMTFKNIISKCKKIYAENASPQLQYLEMLEKMDTTSLEYSSYCFMHAMSNGFYHAKNPSEKSKSLNSILRNNPMSSYLSSMTREPVSGFYLNEHYTTLNLSSNLQEVKNKIGVFGIYGQEDGLFGSEQIVLLESVIGKDNFKLVENASHSVFIDQQDVFFALIKAFSSRQ